MSDKLEALKHSVAMILRSMDKKNVHILEEAIERDATLESELALTKQKLEAAKQRELELLAVIEKMKSAAQAVVDRWETPYWKEIDPTATFIYALRDAMPSEPSQALDKALLEAKIGVIETVERWHPLEGDVTGYISALKRGLVEKLAELNKEK